MTDKQIVQFLTYRANKYGQPLGLHNAVLSICKRGSNVILAMKYEGHDEPFMVRMTKNGQCGLFVLRSDDPEFIAWKSNAIASHALDNNTCAYDLNALPNVVKHMVSMAVIDALKSKDIGLDLFAISFGIST